MMRARWLRLLLVALLTPLLVITTSRTAEAANQNPWMSLDLKTVRTFEGDITCRIVARYTAEGEGVLWNEGDCVNGVDIDPYMDTPPEEGVDYQLTFKGLRLGAPGEQPWIGEGNCGASNLPGTIAVACGDHTGPKPLSWVGTRTYIWTIVEQGSVMEQAHTLRNGACRRQVGTSTWVGGGGQAAPSPYPAGSKALAIVRPLANATTPSIEYEYGSGYTSSCLKGPDNVTPIVPVGNVVVTKIGSTYVPPNSGPAAGAGAGDPCQATVQGKMGASDLDSLSSRAGSIPAGTASFPASDYGLCQINEVCVEWTDDGPFGVGDDTWGACSLVEWDPPYTEEVEGEEPEAPGPMESDVPTADDEPGFWGKVLDLLWGLLKSIVKGLGWVVDAIEAVAGAVIDGIAGLFIPDGDVFDDFNTDVGDAWSGGRAGEWMEAVGSGIPDESGSNGVPIDVSSGKAGITTGSDCEGPGIRWHLLEEAGVGSGGVFYPVKACDGVMAQAADWSKLFLGAVIGLGGLFKIVQILMLSLGASKPGQTVEAGVKS